MTAEKPEGDVALPDAFVYLLNAMENAAQTADPQKHGYAAKRRSVFRYVESQATRIAELTEALRELVACKDLKDRAAKISPVEPGCEKEVLMDEYRRRKPLAWEAARRALSAGQGEAK